MVLSLTIERRELGSLVYHIPGNWLLFSIQSRSCTFSRLLRLSTGLILGYFLNGRVLIQDPVNWLHNRRGTPWVGSFIWSYPILLSTYGWFCSQPKKMTGVDSFWIDPSEFRGSLPLPSYALPQCGCVGPLADFKLILFVISSGTMVYKDEVSGWVAGTLFFSYLRLGYKGILDRDPLNRLFSSSWFRFMAIFTPLMNKSVGCVMTILDFTVLTRISIPKRGNDIILFTRSLLRG